jgi:hypothetical protein
MRSPARILVTDAILMDVETNGEDANEHLQDHRASGHPGHGNGNSSWPTVAHLWARTDLCNVGMPDPSLDLQPNNSVFDTRSPAPLTLTSRTRTEAPTLGTLRRLTIRGTPLPLRSVGDRIPKGSEGAPCEKPG